jgi:hypothetical protein
MRLLSFARATARAQLAASRSANRCGSTECLVGTFAPLCSRLEGAPFKERDGYDLVSYPSPPLVRSTGARSGKKGEAVADALPAALAELEPT